MNQASKDWGVALVPTPFTCFEFSLSHSGEVPLA
jgi:hypothetical protein